jgi:hypothetical protein
MALTSPGVQVTVIDESFYTPAEPGTTPLIVVATAQNKTNSAGTGSATATTAANAGIAFKLTSQKDLLDLFGVPFFEKTASASPVHGGERNEYGLLAAYSLLGVSNAAFIVRANVDLDQLDGQATAPGAAPTNGQWWVDTQNTAWGIQEWNGAAKSTTGGQKFAAKSPIVLTDSDEAKVVAGTPKESVGAIGDYAVVAQTVDGTGSFSASRENITVWYKSAGNTEAGVSSGQWVLVGSNDWAASHATIKGTNVGTVGATNSGDFKINNTFVSVQAADDADAIVSEINGKSITGVTAVNVSNKIYLYSDGTSASNGSTADGKIAIAAVTPGSPVNVAAAGAALVIGHSYKVTVLGTTTNNEWNTIGGTVGITYAVGTEFIAATTGTGTGNGTATADAAVITAIGLASGTFAGPALAQTPHTSVPEWKTTDAVSRPTGSVWIKTTEPNRGARWRTKKYSSATTSWISYEAPIYASTTAALYNLDRTGGGANLAVDTLFVQSNADEDSGSDVTPATASFRMWRRTSTGATAITSSKIASGIAPATYDFDISESLTTQATLSTAKTVSVVIAASNAGNADTIAGAINSAGFTNIQASVSSNNEVVITHKLGGDFRIADTDGLISQLYSAFNINTLSGTANFYEVPAGDATNDFLVTSWKPFAASDFKASGDAPTNEPDDGQLWYNPEFSEVDIMVHNGTTWKGYQQVYATSDPNGPQVAASAPTTQSDGTVLVEGDLWISTADLENFPTIYRWNSTTLAWDLVDKTDQITEDGILFADARWDLDGTSTAAADIVDLLTSDFLDFDAPDPALYPKGMLLWNLRRSGGNVKQYKNNYVDQTMDNVRYGDQSMAAYATDRWTTASANNEDGSGCFGRKAQRKVVVQALKSVVDTSSEIRDEERRNFNIIACPGYPELMSNLVNLNIDRGVTAFVIGDTPLRLPSDATSLTTWGTNANLVTDNGDDGIVTYDEYMGVFYPNGFTTDLGGSNAVVPASHMMMKTIALSDQVSYPWFAPAGTRRGGITNATAVGYIDALSGEFQTVALNEGQRDTLYDLKINPITFFNGVGLVNYGQKTRARNASALDRINVARLTVYLRSQLNKLARPYVFEPNDKITRDEVKQSVESLLLELVGLRAIYDFAVICDESNNTASRIDRNELWVDIAIEPVKAIEFIYIPLRLKNTGEI